MGGGGAMRTVAKIAGIGVRRTGTRSTPTAHLAEHSLKNASRPVAAAVSSQGPKQTEVVSPHSAASWELDDWEFSDDAVDFVGAAGEPRVLFGSVPTHEEAKEATSELKEAIDKIYLSSSSSYSEGSSPGSQVSVPSYTHIEPDSKSCLIETLSNPSVPKNVHQAFQLLSTSPQVQSVVASIACDPNVWDAVMQNPDVYNFFQSHQKVTDLAAHETSEKEFVNHDATAGFEAKESLEKKGNGSLDFFRLLQNLKLSVSEMVSKMSSFLQNLFPTVENEKEFAGADGNSKANFWDTNRIMGGTFIGLATLVIIVVLVRRGA